MPGWPIHVLQLALTLLVIVGPVPFALALVSSTGSRGRGALENLLAACTFTVALQIAVGLVLGSFRLLDAWSLVALEFIALVAGLAALRRTGLPRLWPTRPLGATEAGALIVTLIAAGAGLADLVVRPTRNFDSLAYHLPVMARWVSSSSLEVFPELGQVALYPSHWELLSAMLHLPVHQDLLISVPNLLAWAQLGLAIVLVALALGATRRSALVCAALVLLTPSILSRLDAIQPDIALAATFMTALGFSLRRTGSFDRLGLLVVLVSIGLLAGLKLSGPVYVLFLLPVAILGPAVQPGRAFAGFGGADLRRTLVAGAVAAFALGSFWYLRNWIVMGNPFGDLQISIFGAPLFEGSITRAELQRGALSHVFRPGAGEDWSVLGAVLWEWIGPGGVVLLAGALAAIRIREHRRPLAMIAAMLVLCLVLYWRSPYGGDNGTHGWRVTPWIEVGLRYGFPALALLGALGAAGLGTGRWWPRLGLAVLVAGAVWTVLEHLIPHALVLVGLIVLAWGVSMLSMGRKVSRSVLAPVAGAVVVLLVVGLGLAREQREEVRVKHFGRIVDVLNAELDADDVVLVVHSQKLHLAAGIDWKRRVELSALPEPGREREWVLALRAAGVTALLVGHKEPAPEVAGDVRRIQRFIRESGEFELVYDYQSLAKDLALFRVTPQSSR